MDLELLELVLIGVSIPLLIAGIRVGKGYRHLFMAGADLFFGASWLCLVPHYQQLPDWINVLLVISAVLLFFFLAFQEILNFRFREEVAALDWFSRVGIWTTAMYYVISRISFLTSGFVWLVVNMSVGILQVLGYNVDVGPSSPITAPGGVCYPVNAGFYTGGGVPRISIVLACTGIQAILLLSFAILFARPDPKLWGRWAVRMRMEYLDRYHAAGRSLISLYYRWRYIHVRELQTRSGRMRKLLIFALVVPAVFIANLFRNAWVIWVVYQGYMSFDLAHNIMAKIYAGAVLVVMVLLLFDALPEVQENLLTLKDILKRTRAGMVRDGYVILEDEPEDGKRPEKRQGRRKVKAR